MRRASIFLAVASAFAQNVPHAAYLLPAGGQQGATIQVHLGGQFLNNISAVHISGTGVAVSIGEYTRPMTAMQATALREHMQELQKQRGTPAAQTELADIRTKLLLFSQRRLTSPGLSETLALTINIGRDAEPGRREFRVSSPQGLSNPIVFCVGNFPEVLESETLDIARPTAAPSGNQIRITQPPTDMAITLPTVVNGRIKPRLGTPQQQGRPGQPFTPGESDRYHFHARAGQHLVITAKRARTHALPRSTRSLVGSRLCSLSTIRREKKSPSMMTIAFIPTL